MARIYKGWKVITTIKYPDGKEVDYDDLSEEEKVRVAQILNDRALRAVGYIPVRELEERQKKKKEEQKEKQSMRE